MLVLNRRVGEKIVIAGNIEVVVLEVHNNRVKLGFSGPPEVPFHREELHRRLSGLVEATAPEPVMSPAGCG